LRALTRAETESQTLLTGKIILCHKSINLSSTLIFFVLAFLLLLNPPTTLTAMLFNPARPSLSFSSSLFFVGGFSLSTSTTDRQHTVPFKEKDRAGLGLREYQSFCAIFIKVYSSRCYYQRAPTGDGRHYIYIERERER